jgi:2,3-bisphosphoglycerate-independent phosphoglycerate mutase
VALPRGGHGGRPGPGATGLIDTNYEGKVEAALAFLEHGDFAFVHLEGPDECGHAGRRRPEGRGHLSL